MRKFLFTICFALLTGFVTGQNLADSVEVNNSLGSLFKKPAPGYEPKNLLIKLQPNAAAFAEMKKAKSAYDAGMVFGFVGGALIGWPVGSALGGGEPQWVLAGVGAGVILLALPLSKSYKVHAKKAIQLYNDGTNQTGRSLHIKVGILDQGVGVRLRF
jgi:hypothetical protein